MTRLVYTFNGGTDESTITTSDTGSGNAWDTVTIGGGGGGEAKYDSAFFVAGGMGGRVTPGASGVSGLAWSSAVSATTCWIRAYIYPNTNPGGTRSIIQFRDGGGTTVASLRHIITSNKMGLYDSAGTQQFSTTVGTGGSGAYTATNPFRVEIEVINSATVGHFQAKFFFGSNLHGATPDETIGDLTTNLNLGTITEEVRFGVFANGAESYNFDALGFSDVAYMGPAVFLQSIPASLTLTPAVGTVKHTSSTWAEGAEGAADEANATSGTTTFDAVLIGAGATLKHDTKYAVAGTKSFRVNVPAGAVDSYGQKNIAGAPLETFWRTCLLIDGTTVMGSPCTIQRITDTSGQTIATVALSANLHIIVRDATGNIVSTSAPYVVPVNSWVRIETDLQCDSSTGLIHVKGWNNAFSSGTADFDLTASNVNTGDLGVGAVYMGRSQGFAASLASGPYWLDELAEATATWVGPVSAPSTSVTGTSTVALPSLDELASGDISGAQVNPQGSYFVRIIAKDADGPAPASDPVVGGSVVPINHEDIAADAIWANNILAGTVTAEKLAAVMLLANLLQAGGSVVDLGGGQFQSAGQRVEIDTQGVRFYDQNDHKQIDIPTQAGLPASFQGIVLAGDLPFVRGDGMSRCRVRKTQNQSVTSSAVTPNPASVTFDTEVADTDNYFTKATNAAQFTLPFDGMYLLISRVAWDANNNGYRQTFLETNRAGSFAAILGANDTRASVGTTGVNTPINVTVDYDGLAGEVVRVRVQQTASGPLDIVSGFFAIIYLGPS